MIKVLTDISSLSKSCCQNLTKYSQTNRWRNSLSRDNHEIISFRCLCPLATIKMLLVPHTVGGAVGGLQQHTGDCYRRRTHPNQMVHCTCVPSSTGGEVTLVCSDYQPITNKKSKSRSMREACTCRLPAVIISG